MSINQQDTKRLTGYADKERSKRTFSDAEVIDALQKAAKRRTGNTLTRSAYETFYDMHRPTVPHPHTIIRRFETWNAALMVAGLPVSPRATYRVKATKEDHIRALLTARKELGHLPSVGEYQTLWEDKLRAEGHPSTSSIRVHFKQWRKACEAAARYIS